MRTVQATRIRLFIDEVISCYFERHLISLSL